MKHRSAKVYMNDKFAGVLAEREGGYFFRYDGDYLKSGGALPVSVTLPLREEEYRDSRVFPFFKGLIPEGWLFEINARALKIDPADDFGILLKTGMDCVGAVSVLEEED